MASNLSNRGAKLNYKASGIGHRKDYHYQELTLILSTHIFNIVEVVCDTFEFSATSDAQIRIFEHMLRICVAFAQSRQTISTSGVVRLRYGLDTNSDYLKLLWRLLIGDRTSTDRPAPLGVAELFFT